jgi:hypothetical protein
MSLPVLPLFGVSNVVNGIYTAFVPDTMHVLSGIVKHVLEHLADTIDNSWDSKQEQVRARAALHARIRKIVPFRDLSRRTFRRFSERVLDTSGLTSSDMMQLPALLAVVIAPDGVIIPDRTTCKLVVAALEHLDELICWLHKPVLKPADVELLRAARVR